MSTLQLIAILLLYKIRLHREVYMVMEYTCGTIPNSNLALQDSNVRNRTKVCIPTQTEKITAEDRLISGT
jgi:hypothetical protein